VGNGRKDRRRVLTGRSVREAPVQARKLVGFWFDFLVRVYFRGGRDSLGLFAGLGLGFVFGLAWISAGIRKFLRWYLDPVLWLVEWEYPTKETSLYAEITCEITNWLHYFEDVAILHTNRQYVGAPQREDGEHLNCDSSAPPRETEGWNVGLPVHWWDEVDLLNDVNRTGECPAYFADSVDCGQELEQLLVVRREQVLIGESPIGKPRCKVSNYESTSWVSGNVSDICQRRTGTIFSFASAQTYRL
jgi:hypothetical protein